MLIFLVCKRKTIIAYKIHKTLINLEPSDIWETLYLALMRAYGCSAYVDGNYLCLPIGSRPYEDTNPTTFSRILGLLFHLIKGVTCGSVGSCSLWVLWGLYIDLCEPRNQSDKEKWGGACVALVSALWHLLGLHTAMKVTTVPRKSHSWGSPCSLTSVFL